MDWLKHGSRITELFKKYRYGILIVLLGILLMCLPGGKKEEADASPPSGTEITSEDGLEKSLSAILCQIKGAGKVEVLLTEARGAETLYQTDTNITSDNQRQDTVIISDTGRNQNGLVRQVNPPGYLGAIIVCQGADSATVRLAIVQAVSSVTGLGADHITVLKMK